MDKKLKEMAQLYGIELTDDMTFKFMLYKDLLKQWNEKINLTAITDDNEIIIKHFIDSLTIEKYIPKNARIIDIGTGAGFPGIPLKIVRNDIGVVLLDSLNKRINFLNEVISKLDLNNIETIHGRAEDVARDKLYREKFDISTARAVANISTLLELCTPFLKQKGSFICMKADVGVEIENAQKAVEVLGLKQDNIYEFTLQEIDAARTIIIYKKERSTPKEYPRKAGTPAKNPIK